MKWLRMEFHWRMIPLSVRSAWRYLRYRFGGGDRFVSIETFCDRVGACYLCERYQHDTGQCSVCGCAVSLKAKLPTEDCPHPCGSKWGKV